MMFTPFIKLYTQCQFSCMCHKGIGGKETKDKTVKANLLQFAHTFHRFQFRILNLYILYLNLQLPASVT